MSNEKENYQLQFPNGKLVTISKLQKASKYLLKLQGFKEHANPIEKEGLSNFINSGYLDPSIKNIFYRFQYYLFDCLDYIEAKKD